MRVPQVTDRMRQAPAHALRAVFTGIGQLFITADRLKQQGGQPARVGPAGQGRHAGWREREQDGPARDGAPAGWPPPGRPPSVGTAAGRATKKAGGKAGGSRRAAAASVSAGGTRWRSLDETGNVRLLSAEGLADEFQDPPAPPARADLTAPLPSAHPPETTYPAEAAHPPKATDSPEPAHSPEVTRPAGATAAPTETAEPAHMAGAGDAAAFAALPVPNYDSLSLPSLRARLRTLDAAQVRMLIKYERSHAARTDVVAMFERRLVKLAAGG